MHWEREGGRERERERGRERATDLEYSLLDCRSPYFEAAQAEKKISPRAPGQMKIGSHSEEQQYHPV